MTACAETSHKLTKQELIDFESEIKSLFLDRKIHSPIHLSGGNEDALIEIFQQVKDEDWVVSTYRSHYHALLKGIKADWLKSEILEGHSMHIFSKDHKFISSSIVSGGVPIALGLALGIKLKQSDSKVYCFVGDMAAMTGSFHEARQYAGNWKLPIVFVIEDNGYSVNTPTKSVWGEVSNMEAITYHYDRVYPHSGAGPWVTF